MNLNHLNDNSPCASASQSSCSSSSSPCSVSTFRSSSLDNFCEEITGKFPKFNLDATNSQPTNSMERAGLVQPDASLSPRSRLDINQLDEYSLLNIFSCLTVVERLEAQATCRKWRDLIGKLHRSQSSLGMTMSCANCPNKSHQVSSRECIGKFFQSIKENSSNVYFISAEKLKMVLSSCQNLKTLVMQNCIFNRDSVEVFAKNSSKKLEHIDLSFSSCVINEITRSLAERCQLTLKHVILKYNEINENGLRCVVENCQNVELLILDYNDQVTGECFNLLGPKIQTISLLGCDNVNEEGIKSLVSGHGSGLTTFQIGGNTSPVMLDVICQHMTSLTNFDLHGFLTDSANVYSSIGQLTALRELNLNLPRFAFDNPLVNIIRNCKFLKKVKIDGAIITNNSLIQFPVHCPLIEKLSILPTKNFVNEQITDDCVPALSLLKNLRILSLSDSKVGDGIVEVTNCCPRLYFLQLDGCKLISMNTVNALAEKASANQKDRIMLFVQRTSISRSNLNYSSLPKNLNVFI